MLYPNIFEGSYDEVFAIVTTYANNGNLAIALETEDGEPYTTLTVNLCPLPSNRAFVDTNNVMFAEDFIEKYGLGKPVGRFATSGFCTYPLYEFDLETLEKQKRHY